MVSSCYIIGKVTILITLNFWQLRGDLPGVCSLSWQRAVITTDSHCQATRSPNCPVVCLLRCPQSSRPQSSRPQSSRPQSSRPQSSRPQSSRPQTLLTRQSPFHQRVSGLSRGKLIKHLYFWVLVPAAGEQWRVSPASVSPRTSVRPLMVRVLIM